MIRRLIAAERIETPQRSSVAANRVSPDYDDRESGRINSGNPTPSAVHLIADGAGGRYQQS
jgi:hypothetical protein